MLKKKEKTKEVHVNFVTGVNLLNSQPIKFQTMIQPRN